ncbi:hypothetical protein ACQKWADRAFT_321380 [Trichoderma austrokoningii]
MGTENETASFDAATEAVMAPQEGSEAVESSSNTEKEQSKIRKFFSDFFTYFQLLVYANPTWLDILLLTIGAISAAAAGVPFPLMGILFGQLVDDLNTASCDAKSPSADEASRIQHSIDSKVLELTYIGIASFVLIYIYIVCWSIFSRRLEARIRDRYFQALLQQDATFYDKRQAGELSSRLNADVQAVQSGTSEKVGICIACTSFFLTAYIVAFIKNWRLAVILLSLIPAFFLMAGLGSAFSAKYTSAMSDAIGSASSIAQETLSNIAVVQAFGAGPRLEAKFSSHVMTAQKRGIKKAFVAAVQAGTLYFIAYAANALSFWQGSHQIVNTIANPNGVSVGEIYTVIFLLVDACVVFGGASTAFIKLRRDIETPATINSRSTSGLKLADSAAASVSFRDVSFAYASRPDQLVLKNVSFDCPAGKYTAIVGLSGSGKSTVAGLTTRIYDPQDGKVLLDGHDLKDINVKSLRSFISLVQQEPSLLDRSILENIALGLFNSPWQKHEKFQSIILGNGLAEVAEKVRHGQDLTTVSLEYSSDMAELVEMICQSAALVDASNFIHKLEYGYGTLVGTAGKLVSGGQRQRLAFARALIRDPKILLLDEATASLDSASEQRIQTAVESISKGRTIIAIAHRLSTIKNADNIIVMNNGEIIEQGTHLELMALDGSYAGMVRLQNLASKEQDDTPSLSSTAKGETEIILSEKESSLSEPTALKEDVSGAASSTEQEDSQAAAEAEDKALDANLSGWKIIKMFGLMLRPHLLMLLLAVFSAVIVGGTFSSAGVIFGNTVEKVSPCNSTHEILWAGKFFGGLFFMLAVVELLAYTGSWFGFGYIAEKLLYNIRVLTFRSLYEQELDWHQSEGRSPASLLSIVTADAAAVGGFSGSIMGTMFSIVVNFFIAIILSHIIAWKIAIVCLVTVPILLGSGIMQVRSLSRFERKHAGAFSSALGITVEAVTSHKTVSSLAIEDEILHTYRRALKAPQKEMVLSSAYTNFWLAIANSIGNLIYAFAYWWGSTRITNGEYSQAQFFIILMAMLVSAQLWGQMFTLAPEVSRSRAAASRILSLISLGSAKRLGVTEAGIGNESRGEKDVEAAPNTVSSRGVKPSHGGATVTFRDVSFAYPARPHIQILKNTSFTIPAGQFCGLVGPSGAGKSTIMSLVQRMYRPTAGSVEIDGVDICAREGVDFRHDIAVVPQDCALFDGTVRFNVGLGAVPGHEATDAEIEEACKLANIHDTIVALPKGYDTECGPNGSRLSGGQRQRLAIARALVRKPRLLLLDESTSALDAESERALQEGLEQAARGITVIAITHRLHTPNASAANLPFLVFSIYQLEKTAYQARGGDGESRPLISTEEPEEVFSKSLGIELEKICSFYSLKEGELLEEVSQLLHDVGEGPSLETSTTLRPAQSDAHSTHARPTSLHSRGSDDDDSGTEDDETSGLTRRKSSSRYGRRKTASSIPDMAASSDFGRSRRYSTTIDDYGDQSFLFGSTLYSSAIMLKKRIVALYVQLCELKSYAQLNKTGFSKVLKKFDKILDKELRSSYISTYVDTAYPFKPDTKKLLEENIAKMEAAYADVVTAGDEELARKDLRSHLREHVVWERNTVWRDLIGIERRGEAARIGQTLLGQDTGITPKRLQGDDEIGPAETQIKTPIGRIVLPSWLSNSSVLTLFISVVAFFLLLFVPILQNPEQQNCLALLVFVSLLWATETIPLFVTSLLIPFLAVVLRVVREEDPSKPQKRLTSKEATSAIFSAMWSPVIMLLLGGFTLAAALSKCKIDKRLATLILSKAGTQPRTVLLANMFVAAFASMLISNVAAPVLCFSIIEVNSNMSKAVIIGIALASNIGGMLSPIASPQNVVAMGIMKPEPTWLQWFFIVIPVGIVSIVLIWLLLLITFQPGKGTSIAPIRPLKEKFSGGQWFVAIVTVITIVLWCTSHTLESVFGDMGVVAIIPIVLFFGIGILTKEDFNNFPWTIIILAAGGLSLGKAVRSSGLLHTLAEIVSREVEGMSLYGVLVVFSSLILVIATFISHTVAALIFLPLVYDVGVAMDQPHPNLLVMGGVLMCSAAMGLPTSGFPNMTAIMKEDATGQRYLSVKHFISRGVPSSLLTLVVVVTLGYGIMEVAGDRILVGLNNGALRIYRLNEVTANGASTPPHTANATPPQNGDHHPAQSAAKPTDLLREVERFSTRAVEQLAIIKEANIIVSLSNYHVSLHDLQSYDLIETLSRTKNASCFAITSNIVRDPDTGVPEIISRLAVAVKRRLLLWNWHESELSNDVSEVVLSESIRSITWASATKIVCGMNGGYVIVDATTQEVEDIVSPGAVGVSGQGSRFGAVSSAGMGYMGLGSYIPKPLAAKLADGEMLLAKDINTLFVNDEGKALEKRQIPWQTAPESIGYSYPYIVALQPPSKGSLEVRNPDTLSLMQTIQLPGAAQLHFPPPTSSLAHAGKGFHISSDRCVWKMGATDYDSQIGELIEASRFDEAISVLQMLEDALLKDKKETLREVKMLKAEGLFKQKKFRQSMDLMNEDDVHAPPERVLRMWANCQGAQENAETQVRKTNGTRPNSPEVTASEHAESPTVGGFVKYFKAAQKKPTDVASIISTKKDGETEDSDNARDAPASEDKPLAGKELTKAVLELNSYLAGTRARLQRVIDPVTGKLKPRVDQPNSATEAEDRLLKITPDESDKEREQKLCETFRLVDTTLFRAYMFSQPSLAGSLFRIPNFCDPDVVNERLLEHNRYTELIDFFHGKKLHRSALQLLHQFGAAPKPNETAPTLHGPDRTIQYLQSLPPSEIDLILEHAEWTLKANPEYAMEIFIGDTENAETLPAEKVLPYLRDLDSKLERQYLEHIIMELDDTTADFHNRLVELYVSSLSNSERGHDWDDLEERFVKFLRESRQVYSLTKAFALIPKDGKIFFAT